MTAPGAGRRDRWPETLPCGRDVDRTIEQVADGLADRPDEHQRDCPHCRAALVEYDRIWAPVRAVGAETVTAPDSVLEAALARIRRALDHPMYGLVEEPDGLTRVSARVVVVVARESAQDVPGVRVALSRHLIGSSGVDGPAAAGVAGASTAVRITLAADYGHDLLALAAEVRRVVSATVRDLTDLEPVGVDVVIDDVFR